MAAVRQTVEHVESLEKYKHGFVTEIDQEFAPKGLSEDIVRKVRANGGQVWYILAKDEGHGFVKKPNVDYLFNAEVLFLLQFLLK